MWFLLLLLMSSTLLAETRLTWEQARAVVWSTRDLGTYVDRNQVGPSPQITVSTQGDKVFITGQITCQVTQVQPGMILLAWVKGDLTVFAGVDVNGTYSPGATRVQVTGTCKLGEYVANKFPLGTQAWLWYVVPGQTPISGANFDFGKVE